MLGLVSLLHFFLRHMSAWVAVCVCWMTVCVCVRTLLEGVAYLTAH